MPDTYEILELTDKQDPAFKEVSFGLTDKNRSVQFIRVGEIIEKVTTCLFVVVFSLITNLHGEGWSS